MGNVTVFGFIEDSARFVLGIVLYWESLVTNETGYELLFFLMCGYLAREFQFGT
jgi:hypothetical protein